MLHFYHFYSLRGTNRPHMYIFRLSIIHKRFIFGLFAVAATYHASSKLTNFYHVSCYIFINHFTERFLCMAMCQYYHFLQSVKIPCQNIENQLIYKHFYHFDNCSSVTFLSNPSLSVF